MSRIYVAGWGAVSPAGWSAAELNKALAAGKSLPVQSLERPGWETSLRMRAVPAPTTKPASLGHPRLRRSSPITHYAASALLESVARLKPDAGRRTGLVVCMQSGCVQYTHRFFAETLADPTTASPLVFPETVFAAPTSHLAALLDNTPIAGTIIGDPATFAQGLALGAEWLMQDNADIVIVIGAEEIHWMRADALWHLEHSAIISAGAGAIALCRNPEYSSGVELAAITDMHTYTSRNHRARAARAMREQLGGAKNEILCDGIGGSPRTDAPEIAAWRDWTGARISPKKILGEGHLATAAWQCAAACAAVAGKQYNSAIASIVGCNQQAAGIRFSAV